MPNAIRSMLAAVSLLAVAAAPIAAHAGPMDRPAAVPTPPAMKPMPVEANMVKVRVLIYSGRPDPEFEIPASQIASMMKKSRPMSYKGEHIIPGRLGYKGVLVENPNKAGGLPELFAIYNGKIEAGVKEKTYYADQNRSLENFLVDEAVKRKALEVEMHKRIKMEIKKSGKDRMSPGRK